MGVEARRAEEAGVATPVERAHPLRTKIRPSAQVYLGVSSVIEDVTYPRNEDTYLWLPRQLPTLVKISNAS